MNLGGIQPPRRKPSLTPMIDVVFLLLVFFMLASRFGVDQVLDMPMTAGGGQLSGPPKLVDILPDGARLNGVAMPVEQVIRDLASLVQTPQDGIVLRARDTADPEGARILLRADAAASGQRLAEVMAQLRQIGIVSVELLVIPS